MNLDMFVVFDWISGAVSTYTIFLFLALFFDRTQTNKKLEFLFYSLYFVANTPLYLYVNIPIVMLIANILAFFALTFNYKAKISKRIIATLLVYVVLFAIETLAALVFGFIEFSIFTPNPRFNSVLGIISARIIAYIIVLLIGNYRSLKLGDPMPASYWAVVVFIPLASIYIIIILLQSEHVESIFMIIAVSLVLLINFIVFYLYNALNKLFKARTEQEILKQQNENYLTQFDIVKKMVVNTRSLQHDISKHAATLSTLIDNDEKERALEYLGSFIDESYAEKPIANSGNIAIDSALNYKLQQAKLSGVDVSLGLMIPSDLDISAFDITVILGNLIDNAIDAASKFEKNKRIQLQIKYEKETLFIHIENTFDGKIKTENNRIITTNRDREKHGYGLKNVKHIIAKYDGTLVVNYTKEIFSVDIILYISKKTQQNKIKTNK